MTTRRQVLRFSNEADHDTSSLGEAFAVEQATTAEIAMRFIDTKPFVAIVVEMAPGRSLEPLQVLEFARTVVPQTATIVSCSPDDLERIASDLPEDQEVVVGGDAALCERLERHSIQRPCTAYGRPFTATVRIGGRREAVRCVGLSRDRIVLEGSLSLCRAVVEAPMTFESTLPVTKEPLSESARFEGFRVFHGDDEARARVSLVPTAGRTRFEGLDEFFESTKRGVVCILCSDARASRLGRALDAHTIAHPREAADIQAAVLHCDALVIAGQPSHDTLVAIPQALATASHVSVVLLETQGSLDEAVPPDRLAYATNAPLNGSDVAKIIRGIVDTRRAALTRSDQQINDHALRLTLLLEASRAVSMQTSAAAAATVAAQKLESFLAVRVSVCYRVSAGGQHLVLADQRYDRNEEHPANGGLCGFAVRTGAVVHAAPASSDPRYIPQVDNPLGEDHEQLLIVPITAEDSGVLGLLVLVRASDGPGFSDLDRELGRTFASHIASTFRDHDLRERVDEVVDARSRQFRGQIAKLFLPEAVAHSEVAQSYGEVLQLDDRWSSWGKYVVLALFLFVPFALSVAQVHDTASGPAIIRVEQAADVVAPFDGMVAELLVAEGEHVEQGQALVRLSTQEELAELRRAESEWNRLLIRRLEDPRDAAAEQRLIAVRSEMERARAIVHMRTLAATTEGTVSSIPRKPGELVEQGTIIASIRSENEGGFVEATVSSNFRPLIDEGTWLDLELDDFDNAHVLLQVHEVQARALGPNEVRAMLWNDEASSSARLVLHAPLTNDTFEYNGERFSLREGMSGTARIRLRSKPAIFRLLPVLEEVFGG